MEIQPFMEVARRHRVVFFDSYGVLRLGDEVLPGVAGAIEALAEAAIPYWVLTNDASRPGPGLAEVFGGLIPPERFVSSGLLLVQALQKEPPPGLLAYLGPPRVEALLELAGCEFRPLPELQSLEGVRAVALMDDEGYGWERELNRLVNYARKHRDLPIYLPNPDLFYPLPSGVGLAAGALGALLEAVLERRLIRFGKPAAPIFLRALELAAEEIGELAAGQVLMVGDTLWTDVRGAQEVGLKTALVLSGNTIGAGQEVDLSASPWIPDYVCPCVSR